MDEITLVTHDLTKENTSWYEAHKDAYPHGYWTIDMSVSVNGTPITIKKGEKPSVIVSMSASDGEADTGPLNSINGNYNDPVFRTFNFAPQAPGTYTITFTYGSTTKDISITAN